MSNPVKHFKGKSPRDEVFSDMNHSKSSTVDEHAVRELELYADNDRQTNQMLTSLYRNYQRKKAKGVYNHELAVKGMMNAVNVANKNYKKEFGYSFIPSVRKAVARSMAKHFETEYRLGNRW